MKRINCLFFIVLACIVSPRAWAFARPDKEYKVFQFPRTAIPRIDGDFSDWEIVPDSYSVGLSELYDTHGGRGARLDPREFDLTVKVGWVAGENRLYFYVEAYDDCWDFADEGLRQDIFELDGRCRAVRRAVHQGGQRQSEQAAGLGPSFQRTRSACTELPYLRSGTARQGLGYGVGLDSVDQGLPLCERGVRLRFRARRERYASHGVLDPSPFD